MICDRRSRDVGEDRQRKAGRRKGMHGGEGGDAWRDSRERVVGGWGMGM